jgi:putative hemolysin
MGSWHFFLLLTLLCVLSQGFFSMSEMACVSFNKIRLQYYVSKKKKKAKWINSLLDNPSRLFGTTLITVNLFLQLGSELSRLFYESLNLNPDFAPFSQILLVVVFGELAPLFAARRHPESIALFCAPVLYALSKILTPLTWIIDQMNKGIHYLFKTKKGTNLFLSREEIQKALEENMDAAISFHSSFDHFFSLKDKKAAALMVPLEASPLFPSTLSVQSVKDLMQNAFSPFVMIYHQTKSKIVGILHAKDMIIGDFKKRAIDVAKPPWFITEDDLAFSILRQFRTNNQSMAIVLNKEGAAVGMLSFDQLMDFILGPSEEFFQAPTVRNIIEKKIRGEMTIREFNEVFQTSLDGSSEMTLGEYITKKLGHHPNEGEKYRKGHLEFTVVEVSLFDVKLLNVRTI